MSRVPLKRDRIPAFLKDCTKRLASALPYYQPEGDDRYVHVVRSGVMHYNRDGTFSHVSYRMWCGQIGWGPTKTLRSHRGGRRPATLVAAPTCGRTVCASCLGRSIGSGQLDDARTINGQPVTFAPRGAAA